MKLYLVNWQATQLKKNSHQIIKDFQTSWKLKLIQPLIITLKAKTILMALKQMTFTVVMETVILTHSNQRDLNFMLIPISITNRALLPVPLQAQFQALIVVPAQLRVLTVVPVQIALPLPAHKLIGAVAVIAVQTVVKVQLPVVIALAIVLDLLKAQLVQAHKSVEHGAVQALQVQPAVTLQHPALQAQRIQLSLIENV